MNRLTWVAVGIALVLGGISGVAYVHNRGQMSKPETTVETCAALDAEGLALLETALRWDLSFRSGYGTAPLSGPFDALRIFSLEVDGPGFQGDGDVGIWAMHPAVPPGWMGGAILYSLDSVARRVEGRSIYAGSLLRQFTDDGQLTDDGESVYDPRVLRATAPAVAATCRSATSD